MTSSTSSPDIILGGGSAGESAGESNPGELEQIYENLLSGAADIETGLGTKVLWMDTGAIGTAGSAQIGVTETAGEVAANVAVLGSIAAFCRANNITIGIDANLTFNVTHSDGTNALVDQWAPIAASVGLPIGSIEDVQEVGISQNPATFTNNASVEANSVLTLIKDYAGSSYKMSATNLTVGDMEGGGSSSMGSISEWWTAYGAAAKSAGLPGFTYVTADPGMFAPWVDPLAAPIWQGFIGALSQVTTTDHMALNVVVEGSQTDTSASQYTEQSEQNAIELEVFETSGSANISNILLHSWNVQPVSVGAITSPTSSTNETAELSAVLPLYGAGSITAQCSISITDPSQVVINTGVAHSISSLSIQWGAVSVQAAARLGVVIIDQTGTLKASQSGSGTVSNSAGNILILSGDSVDLAAELKSITLTEPNAGPDTIDIEVFGADGRLSDTQITVLAAAAGQSVNNINATNNQQGWLTSSALLNNGTVIANGSVLTSETVDWSLTGTLAGTITGTTTPGQSAFVKVDTVHEPLAEYGIENVSSAVFGTPTNEILDINDPTVDNPSFNGGTYANNPGVNNVLLKNLTSWLPNSFNPLNALTSLLVESTVENFNPVSGQLEATTDNLAPDPVTVVDRTGTHPDTFATAFDSGGTQVTEFNTGDNPAWAPGWGSQFSSATLTYDGAGQLTEVLLQGGPNDPTFTIDDVFDPTTGQLWEEFQSTTPPPEAPGGTNYVATNDPYIPGFDTGPLYVTEFNTGNNPNWDIEDWGSTISSDTEVWDDNFIVGNIPGFSESHSGQILADFNSYPFEFVNGAALDLLYLPGTISVNLNLLSTVTIGSQVMSSGLAGLSEIDAAHSTGTVTITGIAAGGSTLIGGDNTSFINGYGHDTIIAGSGQTWVNTGGGDSVISVPGSTGSAVVSGDANTVTAVAGGTIFFNGSGETLIGSELSVITETSATSVTITGTDNSVAAAAGSKIADSVVDSSLVVNGTSITAIGAAGDTITASGLGNVINLLNGGTFNQGGTNSASIVNGNNVTVSMNSTGGTVFATGNSDTVIGATSSHITLEGNGDGLVAGIANTITVAGQNDAVFGSGETIFETTSGTGLNVQGSNNTVTVAAGNSVAFYGTLDIAVGSNINVLTSTSTGSAIVDGNMDLLAAQTGSTFYLTGSSDILYGEGVTIVAATNSSLVAFGDNNVVSAVAGDGISFNGTNETLNGSGVTVNLSTVGSQVLVSGTHDIINAAAGDAVDISGAGETLVGSSLTISVGGSTGLAVYGSDDLIVLGGTGVAITASENNTVSIRGTGVNVSANLAALQTLAAAGQLGSISLTDSGTPVLSLTAAQLSANGGALSHITTAYGVAATAVAAANAASEAALAHVTAVSVSDTAANVSANLAALQTLAAAGQLGSISLTDSGTPVLSLTVAQLSANGGALSHITTAYGVAATAVAAANAASEAALAHVTAVSVSDTAANVSANLAALQTLAAAGQLGSISLTDSGTPVLNLTVAQLSANGGALSHITTAYGVAATAVAAANAASEAALAHVTAVSVSDTAANVSANLAALQTLAAAGQLGSISLTDSGTPVLNLTVAQLSANGGALSHITTAYGVAATAVAAANAASEAALAHVTAVSVSDTAANVSANLAALQTLAAAGQLGSISLTDSGTPVLSLTVAQLSANGGALSHITTAYGVAATAVAAANAASEAALAHVTAVSVSDTAANVSANLAALQTLAAAGQLGSISLTDSGTPVLNLTVAQLSANGGALSHITTAYGVAATAVAAANAASEAALAHVTAVSVSDTAANVSANLAALQTLAAAGQLGSISLTDSGTPVLSLTVAQLSANGGALSHITTAYGVAATAVAAANAASEAALAHVTAVSVSDTAANVSANLAALQTLAAAGQLGSISLTDSGTPVLSLTVAQLSANGGALSHITTAYGVAATAVAAANAASEAALAHVTAVSVSDTAANVSANLAALQTLAAAGQLGSISLTDSGTPVLSLTVAQLSANGGALSHITTAYGVAATAVAAANAASEAALAHVTAVSVSDTAANVSANLAALQTLAAAGQLGSISLTDSGTPVLSLTVAQLSANGGALSHITTAYGVAATAVAAANAASEAALAHVTAVSVSDTAANVSANLAALQTLAAAGQLGSISLTDSGTPVLNLSATQMLEDSSVLTHIDSTYNLDPTAAEAADYAARSGIGSVAVLDTAANVVANLDALEILATQDKLASIIFTDRVLPILTLPAAQIAADAGALARISGSYDLGATSASAASVAAVSPSVSVAITDTVANIGASLTELQALAASGKLSTITFADNATSTVTVAASQINPALLADIQMIELGVPAGQGQVLSLGTNSEMTLSVQGTAAVTVVEGANSNVINLGLGTDTVYLGSATETVNGGSGNDIFCVTAATIGATITGGSGSNVLHAQGGGNMVMGTGITGIQTVYLDDGTSGYNFVANQTAGLVIAAGSGTDTVTAGAASQTIYGAGGKVTVLATAANAGVAIHGGSGGTILEVTTSGTVALNNSDSKITVQLSVADTLLNVQKVSTTIVAASNDDVIKLGSGADVVYLDSTNETVEGGNGTEIFCVTAAAIGTTISGGSGSNVLHAQGGGNIVMGTSITGVQTVYLDDGTSGYNFVANQTAGLVIAAGSGSDTVTAGAASQTIYGAGGKVTVLATAANAGVTVHGGSGGTTLEITTSGTVALNSSDSNITVQLSSADTLMLSTNQSAIVQGNTAGNDTFIATSNLLSAGQQITGGGNNNTLLLEGSGTFALNVPGKLTDIQTATVMGAATGQAQVVYLRPGLDLTLTVQDAATVTVVGAANNDVIDLGSGSDTVYLGSVNETVNGGSGNDVFCVTAATIGATIAGGSGSNVLHAQGGGNMVMGAGITRIQTVYLDNGISGYQFVANQTAGLVIAAGSNTDTITAGAASQTIYGAGGNLTVLATADNAGVAVHGGSGGATLEITTGGSVVLNNSDSHITVQLDATSSVIANNDTITAGSGITVFVNGTGDILNGPSVAVSVISSASSLTTSGNDDVINAVSGDTINVSGSNETINGSNITIVASSGTSLTVNGSNDIINLIGADITLSTSGQNIVSVCDTVADVASDISGLEALAADGDLKSITLTDSGTPVLVLSTAQIAADTAVLARISTPYILDPTAAEAISGAELPNVLAVAVVDTAANVENDLDGLQTLAAAGKLASITFTDKTPVLTLSATQMIDDADTLARIDSPYILDISADAATIGATSSDVLDVTVHDMARDVGCLMPTANSVSYLPDNPPIAEATTDAATCPAGDAYYKAAAGGEYQQIRVTSERINRGSGTRTGFIYTKADDAMLSGSKSIFPTASNDSMKSNALVRGSASTGSYPMNQSDTKLIWGTANSRAAVSLQDFGVPWAGGQATSGYPNNTSQTSPVFATADLHNGNISLDLGGGTVRPDRSGNLPHNFGFAEQGHPWVAEPARLAEPSDLGPESTAKSGRPPRKISQLRDDQLTHNFRLRQRMLNHPVTLEDDEILELLLSAVLNGRDVGSIVGLLMKKYRGLAASVGAPVSELFALQGLGMDGVVALKLAHIAAVKMLRTEVATAPMLMCWDQVVDYLSVSLGHERREQFRVLFLDTKNCLIEDEVLGLGTINHAPVYPREIVRRSLELHASALIIVHNHPSGDPTPSQEDVNMTTAIERAAATMGISLYDHIIIGRFGYRSFRQERLF